MFFLKDYCCNGFLNRGCVGHRAELPKKADSCRPSNTVHTYILPKVLSSLSLIFDDPSLFGSFFGFFSFWVYIKIVQCSYYYNSPVNPTKGLHELC